MSEPPTASSALSLKRCWHWAVTLIVLVVGWGVYLLWFVPPSEYDDVAQPGQYNSWFWFLGTVMVVGAALVVENRKKCLRSARR